MTKNLSRPTKILLDLDEVLADFRSAAAYVHRLSRAEMDERFGGKGEEIHEKVSGWWGGDDFWRPIHALEMSFWASLHPLPWMRDVIAAAKRYVGTNWRIVTAPVRGPWSYAGKRLWVEKHIGQTFSRLVLTQDKTDCVGPSILLIDDSEHNCEAFRKAGGQSILFPSEYNSRSEFAERPLPIVLSELDSIFGGVERDALKIQER